MDKMKNSPARRTSEPLSKEEFQKKAKKQNRKRQGSKFLVLGLIGALALGGAIALTVKKQVITKASEDTDWNRIVGYDKDGNPIYGSLSNVEGIIGYDKDGNPIFAEDMLVAYYGADGKPVYVTVTEAPEDVLKKQSSQIQDMTSRARENEEKIQELLNTIEKYKTDENGGITVIGASDNSSGTNGSGTNGDGSDNGSGTNGYGPGTNGNGSGNAINNNPVNPGANDYSDESEKVKYLRDEITRLQDRILELQSQINNNADPADNAARQKEIVDLSAQLAALERQILDLQAALGQTETALEGERAKAQSLTGQLSDVESRKQQLEKEIEELKESLGSTDKDNAELKKIIETKEQELDYLKETLDATKNEAVLLRDELGDVYDARVDENTLIFTPHVTKTVKAS